jgi:hypothetical protein
MPADPQMQHVQRYWYDVARVLERASLQVPDARKPPPYGVAPADPVTLLAATVVLLLIASSIPALRASRIYLITVLIYGMNCEMRKLGSARPAINYFFWWAMT